MIKKEDTDFKFLFELVDEYYDSNQKLVDEYYDSDQRFKIVEKFKNIDLENFENKYDWSDQSQENRDRYDKVVDNFYNIGIEDIKDAYNSNKIEIIEYNEPFISEVIRFDASIKIITEYNNGVPYYIKLQVYDDLSPNRWFNLPGEGHLDDTKYNVYIKAKYSRNRKFLK